MLHQIYKKATGFCAAVLTATAFLLSQLITGVIGGENTVFYGDLYIQYIPFIKMFLRALKGQESFWYSFSIYLGSGTALTYTYYTLSPFNLLYLIETVPAEDMTLIIITLKLALSAASFSFFARKSLKTSTHTALLFAPAYALSTFSAAFLIHIMWLDTLYMLPLLAHFTLKTAKGTTTNKDNLLLSLSFAYLFITNFYIAFMVGVFLALLFLAAGLDSAIGEKKINIFFKRGFSFAFSVVLAAGLCACLILPAGLFLYRNSAADNFEFQALTLTLPDIIKRFFIGEMKDLDNTRPFLYCSIPALLLYPFFFILKDINLRTRLFSGGIILFYTLSILMLPLYKFMHAFDFPNYYAFRFSFCLIFFILSLTAICFEKNKGSGIYIWGLLLAVFYSVIMRLEPFYIKEYEQSFSPRIFLLNICFIILWLFFIFIGQTSKKHIARYLTILIMFIELCSNMTICLVNRGKNVGKAMSEFKYVTEDAAVSALHDMSDAHNGSYFSRISVNRESNSNAPSLFGYAGFNTFSSSDDYELRKLLHNLGVSSPNRAIFEQGYTPVTYALLDTGYYIDLPEMTVDNMHVPENTINDISIKKSDYAVPLIFMAADRSLNYVSGSDPFINQNILLSSLTGKDYSFFTPVSNNNITQDYFNSAADLRKDDMKFFYRKSKAIPSASANYLIKSNHDIYLCFSHEESQNVDNAPKLIRDFYGAYNTMRLKLGTIIKASDIGNGSKTAGIEWDNNSNDDICKNIYFYEYTGEEALKNVCDILSNNGLNIAEFSSDHIRGKIHADEAFPVFMTTIPYDTDWHIFVDGKEAETSALLEEAFLGLEHLEPGEHEIELIYIPSGFKEGLIISIIALLLIIARYMLRSFRKKTKL